MSARSASVLEFYQRDPTTAVNSLFERCVNAAIDRAGQAKAVAGDAGLSECQFSRQRREAPHFIDRLPLRLQRSIAKAHAEALGFRVIELMTDERLAELARELEQAMKRLHELTAAHVQLSRERRRS